MFLKKAIHAIPAVLLTLLCMAVLLMSQNQKTLNQSQEIRYQSYLLADELRQSSDDLTRLARTYVITGDKKYEQMYWDVLAIRNGEKPRPQDYGRIYRDLVLKAGDKPRPDEQAIALNKLMEQLGFTREEFAKLKEAQDNSDGLVKTETIAMNAMKGLFDDGKGQFTRQGKPDPELARRIMHDDQYHANKALIMKPVNDFFERAMPGKRTR